MRIYHGKVYHNGKAYATLREALLDVWPKTSSVGPTWDEVRRELFTPDEIEASNRRVAEIGRNLTQLIAKEF